MPWLRKVISLIWIDDSQALRNVKGVNLKTLYTMEVVVFALCSRE
jgi:hypothetical protein